MMLSYMMKKLENRKKVKNLPQELKKQLKNYKNK